MKALLLSIPVLLLAVAASADDAKPDQEQIQGTWKIDSFEQNGSQASAEDRQKISITFREDKAIVKDPKEEKEFQFTLIPTTKPKSIDITHLAGDEKGKSQFGIYVLEDGKLTVCMGEVGENRPMEFRSRPKVVLAVFERAE